MNLSEDDLKIMQRHKNSEIFLFRDIATLIKKYYNWNKYEKWDCMWDELKNFSYIFKKMEKPSNTTLKNFSSFDQIKNTKDSEDARIFLTSNIKAFY